MLSSILLIWVEQIGQIWVFSLVWTKLCDFRFKGILNALVQFSQLYGLSLVWSFWWSFQYDLLFNDLLRSSQMKFFSFTWTFLLCVSKCVVCVKYCVHIPQWKGFSPVWVLVWNGRDGLFDFFHTNSTIVWHFSWMNLVMTIY